LFFSEIAKPLVSMGGVLIALPDLSCFTNSTICSGESFIKPKENDDGDLADFSSSFSFLDFSYILLRLWSPTEGHLFPGNFKHRHLSA
jgi:hypothetical protein